MAPLKRLFLRPPALFILPIDPLYLHDVGKGREQERKLYLHDVGKGREQERKL